MVSHYPYFPSTYGGDRVTPDVLLHVDPIAYGGDPPPSELMPSQDMIRRCLGPQPLSFDRGFRGVLPCCFEKEYIWAMDQSSEEEIGYLVRAFLLYMFTQSVFSGKSDRIFLNFLPTLDNLSKVNTFGWGRSALE